MCKHEGSPDPIEPIRNQQVLGSSPSAGSTHNPNNTNRIGPEAEASALTTSGWTGGDFGGTLAAKSAAQAHVPPAGARTPGLHLRVDDLADENAQLRREVLALQEEVEMARQLAIRVTALADRITATLTQLEAENEALWAVLARRS
jgi:hypothetical protein